MRLLERRLAVLRARARESVGSVSLVAGRDIERYTPGVLINIVIHRRRGTGEWERGRALP